tara:strand:- start:746 stop:1030 length:285 start_codon:yes stop_codon:yes gene_type:complete
MTDNILIDLSYYLKDTNILKVLLPIIDQFLRHTFKTNEELKYAVDKWCDKRHKKIYGHISYWNTKYITNMSNFYCIYGMFYYNCPISEENKLKF